LVRSLLYSKLELWYKNWKDENEEKEISDREKISIQTNAEIQFKLSDVAKKLQSQIDTIQMKHIEKYQALLKQIEKELQNNLQPIHVYFLNIFNFLGTISN
jgi:DNA polymerase III gamma/tau subunit